MESTLSLFCQNRRSEEKERFSCSFFSAVPARPSAVPSFTSTAKPGPSLHISVGEPLVTVAWDDSNPAAGTQQGQGHGTAQVTSRLFQEASSTSGTAPHLAQQPQTGSRALQTQLPPGHPCSQPQGPRKVLRGTHV